MTEEIEAHVLKKYEILQKLGKSQTKLLLEGNHNSLKSNTNPLFRKGSIWYCVEGN